MVNDTVTNKEVLDLLEVLQEELLEEQIATQRELQEIKKQLSFLLEDQKSLKIMLQEQNQTDSMENTDQDVAMRRFLRLIHEAEITVASLLQKTKHQYRRQTLWLCMTASLGGTLAFLFLALSYFVKMNA